MNPINLGPYATLACQQIRDRVRGALMRFDPITILTILSTLLPVLFGLCKQDDPVAQHKAAQDAWDPAKQQYKRNVLAAAVKRTRWAAKQNGVNLRAEEALALATQSLDEIRLASPIAFRAVWTEMSKSKTVATVNQGFELLG